MLPVVAIAVPPAPIVIPLRPAVVAAPAPDIAPESGAIPQFSEPQRQSKPAELAVVEAEPIEKVEATERSVTTRSLPSPLAEELGEAGNGSDRAIVLPDVPVATLSPTFSSETRSSETRSFEKLAVSQNAPSLLLEEAAGTPAETMMQVTSVSELSDVQPTDWAFGALQSMVERYGCIVGYPNRTYGGNRPLSRYEFAAGLNACITRVEELLAGSSGAYYASKEDLATLAKLQQEFSAELALLRGRVDSLEARTAQVERQQFSTTVLLGGQVIFGLATAAGGEPPGLGETKPILTSLAQLQLVSSFTGRDLLRTVFTAGNFGNEGFVNRRSLNTYMAFLSYQNDNGNQLELSSLEYRFAVGDRLVLSLQPVGFSLSSVLSPNSSYTDAATGAVSRFAAMPPYLRIGNLDAGAGLDWLLSDKWRVQFAYGARNANQSNEGVLRSNHQAFGLQLLHKPNTDFVLGLAYINGYASDGRLDTFTGSQNADISGGFDAPAKIHALSLSMRWRVAPRITLGAWGGLALTDATFGRVFDAIFDRDIDLEDIGSVTLSSTYLVSLGIEDPFGRKGDQLVVLVGQPPKLNVGVLVERERDPGTSIHIETFYRFRLTDRISISPGVFYVTDPGHIPRNNSIFVGTIRASFNF